MTRLEEIAEHPAVEVASRLPVAPSEVWSRVTTPEGINDELRPWLRMTVPRPLRGSTIDDVPVGKRLGRSWILLFGLLPVDFDDLWIAELEPGRRFLESSTMLSMRTWRHERTVEPVEGGTLVTDRLTFELRAPLRHLPVSRRLAARIVDALFRHRHRRLTQRFGSPLPRGTASPAARRPAPGSRMSRR